MHWNVISIIISADNVDSTVLYGLCIKLTINQILWQSCETCIAVEASGTLHCGYNWTFLRQMYNGWTQYIYIFKIVTVYPLFLSKPLSIFIFLPSLGFHKPPFISVNHLHLHVIAPSSQICDFMIYKFIPGTESFILVSACLLYFIILISVTFHILL